jgi:hypothetical protein
MKSKRILIVTLRREEFAGHSVRHGKIFRVAENRLRKVEKKNYVDHARLRSYRPFCEGL